MSQRGTYTKESEPVEMDCPQGCQHGSGLTMRRVVKSEPRDHPIVIEGVPGGPAVSTRRTKRYFECRVCGWVVDV